MTAESDPVIRETLNQERMVLDDIHRRTGMRFQHLASIDRNQADVMKKILPIAKEWINSGLEEIRGALYFCFLTPAALPYLEDVLTWAQNESGQRARDPVDREVLTQVMRLIVTPKTARRIWEVHQALDPTSSDFLLLAKLARPPSVSEEVVACIMRFLVSADERINRGERVRTFALGALQEYSRLHHPKVREWFSRYIESSDPELRAVARRSSGIKPVLPKGCRVVPGMPDHSRVVLSTEIDFDHLADFLRELERDFEIQFVSDFSDKVGANLMEEKWIVCEAVESNQRPLEVWLRLEDSTTIEAWVVSDRHGRRQ